MEIEELVLQLQQEASKHYERMIETIKTFPKKDIPSQKLLKKIIDESWFGEDCTYCDYFDTNDGIFCPLDSHKNSNTCGLNCCNYLWVKMNFSQTWEDWLVNSLKILNYIKKYGTRIRRK
jgi:hypothetical protein